MGIRDWGLGRKSFFRFFCKRGEFSTTERARSRRYTKASLSANLASEIASDAALLRLKVVIPFFDFSLTYRCATFARSTASLATPSGFTERPDTKSRVRGVTKIHQNASAGGTKHNRQRECEVRSAKHRMRMARSEVVNTGGVCNRAPVTSTRRDGGSICRTQALHRATGNGPAGRGVSPCRMSRACEVRCIRPRAD